MVGGRESENRIYCLIWWGIKMSHCRVAGCSPLLEAPAVTADSRFRISLFSPHEIEHNHPSLPHCFVNERDVRLYEGLGND
jgi:hypothetical protein